ncbi:serine hydrolase domain-containing protein [Pseudomarimonas arenosa]|uniref:Beta-lactamase family protein n=1 Tax=Pseudomarimonas arenosa TaxID=2774145 RepID=A0AAW3ZE48_9GAMM|nr:serine hydrolase domain-containing protein [Pseudomarimonas arenosa]MBD8524473.1 beta-lactamase family protein [Pseudomarimonas arenosa]
MTGRSDQQRAVPMSVESAGARIEDLLSERVSDSQPGCAIGICRRGELLWQRGFGLASVEHGVPIDPLRTVFDIGSTSKQFTAACVFLLAEQGAIELEHSIDRYLPELPSYAQSITIRHLIHHTSGLRDYIALLNLAGVRDQDYLSEAAALAMIARQPYLEFAPGSEFRYCNSGYFLLSLIVQRASGQSLAEFARQHVFEPLGMQQTRFLQFCWEVVPHRACAYAPLDEREFAVLMANWEQTGDGGVQTSVADLCRWDGNFYTGQVGGAKLIAQLHQCGVLSNGQVTDYGGGLVIEPYRGLPSVLHGGAWAGYRAELLRFPEQEIAFLVLCNRADLDPTDLAHAVADLILAPLLESPAEARLASGEYLADDAELEALCGVYWSEEQRLLRSLRLSEGVLYYGRDDGSEQPLRMLARLRAEFDDQPGQGGLRWEFGVDGSLELHIELSAEPPLRLCRMPAFSPSADQLASYCGHYVSTELDVQWTLIHDEGELRLQTSEEPPIALLPVFEQAFVGNGWLLRFPAVGAVIDSFMVDAGRASGIRFQAQS